MLFLKRLSDRFDDEVANAVTAGVSRAAAVSDPDEHQFAVPETAHWSQIGKAAMNLGEALNVASHEIEDANAGRIDGVLTGTNWNDESKLGSPATRERIIRSLLNHFNDLDLRDTNFASDREGTGNVLGDAYEYLIYQFADDAGKKGRRVLHPTVGRAAYRGVTATQGRNAHLRPHLRVGRGCSSSPPTTCREQGGNRRNLVLAGQERNLGTFAIGKLNMLLHGLASARLVPGDVIVEPGLVDREGRLQSYDPGPLPIRPLA